jgi:RNA polymerase primary sigma factor|tara:strand:+ start:626 stop:1429 length:804 start_codon:yes stop_codon:yes gene_type:complete
MGNKRFIDTKEDGLSIYLKDVRKSDTISQERELILAKRIVEGDKRASDELVKANLRFVISIAKQYQSQGVALADLISEGNYGLITAAQKFDHTKGYRFISYAVWWVKQAIKHCLNENSRTVRLPANMINKMSKLRKETDMFEKENYRLPRADEVEYVQVPYCNSLSTPINEDGTELSDMIADDIFGSPDDVLVEEESLKIQLGKAMECLSDREKNIVNCYFGIDGEPMTLAQIGEEYQLTKERIRQIKESAIRKIRHNTDGVFDYLM